MAPTEPPPTEPPTGLYPRGPLMISHPPTYPVILPRTIPLSDGPSQPGSPRGPPALPRCSLGQRQRGPGSRGGSVVTFRPMDRAGAGVTVFVADDDEAIRLLCRLNLGATGHNVIEAATL